MNMKPAGIIEIALPMCDGPATTFWSNIGGGYVYSCARATTSGLYLVEGLK